jgi:hypothetical protein
MSGQRGFGKWMKVDESGCFMNVSFDNWQPDFHCKSRSQHILTIELNAHVAATFTVILP